MAAVAVMCFINLPMLGLHPPWLALWAQAVQPTFCLLCYQPRHSAICHHHLSLVPHRSCAGVAISENRAAVAAECGKPHADGHWRHP